jgi:hypothetical protein
MLEILTTKLYITYPKICILCTDKIKVDNIVCEVCISYLPPTLKDKIMVVRNGNSKL